MIGPAEAARWCDVVSMHGYPIYADWAAGPTDSELVPFLAEVTRWLAAGAPVLFEEFGAADRRAGRPGRGPRSTRPPPPTYTGRALDGLRAVGCGARCSGASATTPPSSRSVPPFDAAPHELSFGLWRADGTAKPAVAEVTARAGAALRPAGQSGRVARHRRRHVRGGPAPSPPAPLRSLPRFAAEHPRDPGAGREGSRVVGSARVGTRMCGTRIAPGSRPEVPRGGATADAGGSNLTTFCDLQLEGGLMAPTETEIVQGIGSDYAEKYGFSNPDEAKDYFFKSGRGISHEVVEAIAEHKNEPAWMRKVRHKALDYFLARPMPTWGGDLSGIDFDNIYYYIKPTEKQAELVGGPAGGHPGHLGQAGHPRGREEVPRRRRRPVRVRGRLPQPAGEADRAGRALPRHGLGAARARGARQAVLRHDHPVERQQVRGAEHRRLVGRLLHLRAAGREDRAAAPGLLPHQRGEHGPVRAHA